LLEASGISLAELLRVTRLTQKRKLLLSYMLAQATWQFYDSDWMQHEWIKNTVQFMFEQRTGMPKGIFINEPFLSARLPGRQLAGEARVDNNFRVHLFPKILAVGILFLEIELGINIEDHRPPDCIGPDGRPSVNADHIAATEVFENAELWEDTFAAFREVIGICLMPDSFVEYLGDTDGLRNHFEKKVVLPLQQLYRNAWGIPEESEVRPIGIDTLEAQTSSRVADHAARRSASQPIVPTQQTAAPSPLQKFQGSSLRLAPE